MDRDYFFHQSLQSNLGVWKIWEHSVFAHSSKQTDWILTICLFASICLFRGCDSSIRYSNIGNLCRFGGMVPYKKKKNGLCLNGILLLSLHWEENALNCRTDAFVVFRLLSAALFLCAQRECLTMRLPPIGISKDNPSVKPVNQGAQKCSSLPARFTVRKILLVIDFSRNCWKKEDPLKVTLLIASAMNFF